MDITYISWSHFFSLCNYVYSYNHFSLGVGETNSNSFSSESLDFLSFVFFSFKVRCLLFFTNASSVFVNRTLSAIFKTFYDLMKFTMSSSYAILSLPIKIAFCFSLRLFLQSNVLSFKSNALRFVTRLSLLVHEREPILWEMSFVKIFFNKCWFSPLPVINCMMPTSIDPI